MEDFGLGPEDTEEVPQERTIPVNNLLRQSDPALIQGVKDSVGEEFGIDLTMDLRKSRKGRFALAICRFEEGSRKSSKKSDVNAR
jgi:hypothetical protein